MSPPARWRPGDWPSVGMENLRAPGNPQDIPPMPRGLRRGRVTPNLDGGLPISPVFDESDYPVFNGSVAIPLPNSISTLVLARPNALRNALVLRNAATTANIYINFGGGSASLLSIIRIVPGNHVLFDRRVPQDEVYAFSDAADGVIVIANAQTPGTPAF